MTRAPDLTDRPDMADIEPLQTALQIVLAQTQQMDLAAVDPTFRRQLTNLAQACTALQTLLARQVAPVRTKDTSMDQSVFDGLMRMAGPDTAQDLLDRLVEDLETAQRMLTTAQHPPDWEVLRMQSHILIGLAGAVGAEGLQTLAQDLNIHANDQQQGGLATLMARLMPALAGLIRYVNARRTTAMVAR